MPRLRPDLVCRQLLPLARRRPSRPEGREPPAGLRDEHQVGGFRIQQLLRRFVAAGNVVRKSAVRGAGAVRGEAVLGAES